MRQLLFALAIFVVPSFAVAQDLSDMKRDGPWAYTTRTDRFTDKESFVAFTLSRDDDQIMLHVECRGDRMMVSLNSLDRGKFVVRDGGTIMLRFDKERPLTYPARVLTNQQAVVLPKAGDTRLLDAISKHKLVSVRIEEASGRRHDYQFNLQPNSHAFANHRARCR